MDKLRLANRFGDHECMVIADVKKETSKYYFLDSRYWYQKIAKVSIEGDHREYQNRLHLTPCPKCPERLWDNVGVAIF
jgi:hypothetical protein